MPASHSIADQLCLTCGLCCNGVIFRDVELQPGEDATRLQSLGLPVRAPRAVGGLSKFPQPCAALEGCRCRIYADRPAYCRQFECALFQSVQAGRVGTATAQRLIRAARRRAARILRLLRRLGDTEEDAALPLRFRRMKRRMETGGADREAADLFGKLTLEMHGLNQILRRKFYPDPADA